MQSSTAATRPLDGHLWHVYGKSYDLTRFVDKHPGGRLAILSGQGRDCTALFDSYHPWSDKHRQVLKAYGAAPPPPDPFYAKLQEALRLAFPEGAASTKMRASTFVALLTAQTLAMYLFFIVRTPLCSLGAGILMALFGTRLSHEGSHWQCSSKSWMNRFALFYGYFLIGPSMCWHYQHIISHHAHTNEAQDCDVEYLELADKLPALVKVLVLPFAGIGAAFQLGPQRLFQDLLWKRSVGGNKVYWHFGQLLPEALVWTFFHLCLGPPVLCYVCMYFTAGSIFVVMSQIAHVIVFPDQEKKHDSWAKRQITASVNFASESTLWYHLAFGLTTQIEHHLFPGVGHHCYSIIRELIKPIAKEHGVTYIDLPAGEAFKALTRRIIYGVPLPLQKRKEKL